MPPAPLRSLEIWSQRLVFFQGLAKARTEGLLEMDTFDMTDYETYEKVENGDSTWILPGVRCFQCGAAEP